MRLLPGSRAESVLALDINFGDPVTPAPVEIDYPGLRGGTPSIPVLGYPLVTVIAEKVSTVAGCPRQCRT